MLKVKSQQSKSRKLHNGRNGKSHYGQDELRSLEGNVRKLAADGTIAAAARQSIQDQRAAGLAITYMKGNLIVKEHADGRTEVVDHLPPAPPFKRPRGVGIIESK